MKIQKNIRGGGGGEGGGGVGRAGSGQGSVIEELKFL